MYMQVVQIYAPFTVPSQSMLLDGSSVTLVIIYMQVVQIYALFTVPSQSMLFNG